MQNPLTWFRLSLARNVPVVPIDPAASAHFENSIDLDTRSGRQGSDTNRGACMTAALAKHGEHQVGGTVDYFWNVGIAGLRKDETAQPMTAHHPIEIAIECLRQRRQQIQPT
jgi:hypothetical protein